jgi:proton-dependent oligopeptide transporter, POT family
MPAGQSDDMWIGAKHDPSLLIPGDPTHPEHRRASMQELPAVVEGKPTLRAELIDPDSFPSEEELHTLPRVADHINWRIYTIAFVGTAFFCLQL